MASKLNLLFKTDFAKYIKRLNSLQVRHLNLQEYQSKTLLQKNGVAVQAFRLLDNTENINSLKDFNVAEYVIKAQVLAGGRGKGHFDNGFQGGVHITKDSNEILPIAKKMIGHKLITKQTKADGILVQKVMVAQSVDICRETYLCIIMDRANNGPVIIASPEGGMDIEAVAEKTPHLVKTYPIDIIEGVSSDSALAIAEFLNFKGDLKIKAQQEILKLWNMFKQIDAVQLEVNPLAETTDGKVITVDAKINFDDNAEFRQKEIFQMGDESEVDPREVEAAKYNLNYIGMDGNIGCLVNGAGLAMATMDIIKLNGGDPANFLDVGGGVNENQVINAFKILMSDPKVEAILVNVFGGIVNCVTIANGIVNALKKVQLNIPLVVRLEGTNVDAAKDIIKNSGLPIISAVDLDDAAAQAISAIAKNKH
uniref:Succinate--CoA ligase [GDP-forming] subunit beta, mitochondrial n=1 Tax=Xenopsylla cheopis TaxID=163159 RepID=A0A6M2DKB6_XENCH